jgi:hypothetical protein
MAQTSVVRILQHLQQILLVVQTSMVQTSVVQTSVAQTSVLQTWKESNGMILLYGKMYEDWRQRSTCPKS